MDEKSFIESTLNRVTQNNADLLYHLDNEALLDMVRSLLLGQLPISARFDSERVVYQLAAQELIREVMRRREVAELEE